MPAHAKVALHQCNLHETHHSSEIAFLETAYINNMFCASAVLRSGPVMRDLVHAACLGLGAMFLSIPFCVSDFRLVFGDLRGWLRLRLATFANLSKDPL